MTYDQDKKPSEGKVVKIEEEGHISSIPQEIKEMLSEGNECYVLITCGKPSENGKMQVEMTYEGDAHLAAYLLENAQDFIEE